MKKINEEKLELKYIWETRRGSSHVQQDWGRRKTFSFWQELCQWKAKASVYYPNFLFLPIKAFSFHWQVGTCRPQMLRSADPPKTLFAGENSRPTVCSNSTTWMEINSNFPVGKPGRHHLTKWSKVITSLEKVLLLLRVPWYEATEGHIASVVFYSPNPQPQFSHEKTSDQREAHPTQYLISVKILKNKERQKLPQIGGNQGDMSSKYNMIS